MRRVLSLMLLTATAACAHARKETPPVAERPPAAVIPAAPAPMALAPTPVVAAPAACQADDQCTGDQLCVQSRCVAIDTNTAACNDVSTHFDFDRAIIHENDFPTLQREARCMTARPQTKVRIEGNCDERGTTAYNLVLGQRRAAADQKYLVNLGVPKGRISTVSYGKERPRCKEETESCWAQNRRDDLEKVQ